MIQDVEKQVSPALSITPVLVAATANGTAVDLLGYMANEIFIVAGVITDGTHTLKLQDSDDNSTWADVAAANVSTALTALTSGAGGSAIQKTSYTGLKRYLRVVTTVTGSPGTGGVYGAIVVRTRPRTI